MKFFIRYLLFTLVFLNIIKESLSKLGHPSQGTRNYRKHHTDPSFNPLPANYHTGPRYNFARHTPAKYKPYNARLSHAHHYKDTTRILADRARHLDHQ